MISPTRVAISQEQMTDEDVVTKVLQGETALFEIVMRRHNQRLYRVARAILHNEDASRGCDAGTRMCALTSICTSLRDGPNFPRG